MSSQKRTKKKANSPNSSLLAWLTCLSLQMEQYPGVPCSLSHTIVLCGTFHPALLSKTVISEQFGTTAEHFKRSYCGLPTTVPKEKQTELRMLVSPTNTVKLLPSTVAQSNLDTTNFIHWIPWHNEVTRCTTACVIEPHVYLISICPPVLLLGAKL